jgi:predicted RNase H-like HicB family nuclease
MSDNIFVASVPELPGCMAHGKTPEIAMKEIKIAMELWLEDAKENGETIPEPMMCVS